MYEKFGSSETIAGRNSLEVWVTEVLPHPPRL